MHCQGATTLFLQLDELVLQQTRANNEQAEEQARHSSSSKM
jgi:hypothetical protein